MDTAKTQNDTGADAGSRTPKVVGPDGTGLPEPAVNAAPASRPGGAASALKWARARAVQTLEAGDAGRSGLEETGAASLAVRTAAIEKLWQQRIIALEALRTTTMARQ